MKIFNKILLFRRPPACDIIIYDEWHSENIIKYILKERDYFIYHAHPEKVRICYSVVFKFFKRLSLFKITEVIKRDDTIRAFFSQILYCYRMATFDTINPRVVITMIDNSGVFHELAKEYKGAEFFAIQNALRVNYDLKKSNYYIPHYFTFGEYTKDVLTEHNHVVLNYYPIGSFRLGIADKFMRSDSKKKYNIGIVSQYRPPVNDIIDPDLIKRNKSNILMHKLLSKYINQTGRSAAIIMATNLNSEVDYYKNYYTESVDLLPNIQSKLSSFDALHRCDIIIAFFSSLSIEALGLGRKVLRIDFTDSKNWNDYKSNILITKPNYDELKDRLEKLLIESYLDYRNSTKKYATYLMNYNQNYPPHEFIRKKLEEFL